MSATKLYHINSQARDLSNVGCSLSRVTSYGEPPNKFPIMPSVSLFYIFCNVFSHYLNFVQIMNVLYFCRTKTNGPY